MTDTPKTKPEKIHLRVSGYEQRRMDKFSTGRYYLTYPTRHKVRIFQVHTPELFLSAVKYILADLRYIYYYSWEEPSVLEMTPEVKAVAKDFPDVIRKIEESQKEYTAWYEHEQIALYFDEYDPVALFWYLSDTFGVQVEEFDN
ncbi:hypothetical protein KDA11_02775 [Candidatus Saccharibacteria bacterium]|nr:hypothetical protein [Candidatus Saccharibacteria bacterium]